VVEQLARAQRECGIATAVACSHGATPENAARQMPKPALSDLFAGRGAFSNAFREHSRGFDAIHLHGVWDPILLVAAKMAHRMGTPYVVTPHGMLDPWSMRQKSRKKKIALAMGYRRMLNRAAAIHWLNEDERTLAEPLGFRAKPIVVPNGLPREFLVRVPSLGRVRSRLPTSRPYVLFLSRLHYKKGLDILAEAFAILVRNTPAHLVVVGPDGGAQAEFERRIAELGLQSSVSVIGPMYGDDKWAALDDAACFCLPSRQEGFSMAILEAIGSGLPAVVSEECHFSEVESVGAGFVVPLTPEAVAEGLRKVLAESNPRTRWGENGRKLVAEKYTWDRIAIRWAEVYPELAGGLL
jgi:glycosyltransferase involved in cell wall biosynthesis